MNGTFQATYVDPSQLTEATPAGTYSMPNFYYASNQTANQLAQLLGGTVVLRPPFGGNSWGGGAPLANFIQLPSGQTVNAADLAYYGRSGAQGAAQLTADLTQTVNVGAAWSNYYMSGGTPPNFAMGYVGPAIANMTYPAGSIGADGNVINPAMQNNNT